MTSLCKTKTLTLLVGICVVFLTVQVSVSQAQEPVKIPPKSDYMFRKDYAAVEEIKKSETDSQKRADALLAWVKAHPESRAIPTAAAFYGEVVYEQLKGGNAQKALTMIQTFQAAAPEDVTLQPYLMASYVQTNNLAKAAEVGEKMYAANPSLGLANDLYGLYAKLNNTDKLLVYGEKLLAEVSIDKSYGVALQMAQIYGQRKNTEKTLQYFTMVMNAYGDKVPPGVKEADWNATRTVAYSALAADAYQKKDYAKAISLFTKVTTFSPKTDEAWYYIGMAQWQNKDQKTAIENFAKAYVIGKTFAPKAKEYMEQLYKAEHSDSLDGLDQILAKAKSDLGIG